MAAVVGKARPRLAPTAVDARDGGALYSGCNGDGALRRAGGLPPHANRSQAARRRRNHADTTCALQQIAVRRRAAAGAAPQPHPRHPHLGIIIYPPMCDSTTKPGGRLAPATLCGAVGAGRQTHAATRPRIRGAFRRGDDADTNDNAPARARPPLKRRLREAEPTKPASAMPNRGAAAAASLTTLPSGGRSENRSLRKITMVVRARARHRRRLGLPASRRGRASLMLCSAARLRRRAYDRKASARRRRQSRVGCGAPLWRRRRRRGEHRRGLVVESAHEKNAGGGKPALGE